MNIDFTFPIKASTLSAESTGLQVCQRNVSQNNVRGGIWEAPNNIDFTFAIKADTLSAESSGFFGVATDLLASPVDILPTVFGLSSLCFEGLLFLLLRASS